MMQTGPVVTLQVAKSGASYHGLSGFLNGSTAENPAGGGDRDKPNSDVSMLYCVVDLGPSDGLHAGSKRKEQMMQRNRQLYRSNPNMTIGLCLKEGDESTDLDVKRNITSLSSSNLCTDTYHREYLTLPNPKSKDKAGSDQSRPQQTFKPPLSPSNRQSSARNSLMRQAVSQEYLCMDDGGPLLDQRENTWTQRDQISKQPTNLYSSFPIRSSVSAHDVLCGQRLPSKQQQGNSSAGVWRTPFKQQSAPTPSVQPIRIDIPITRAVDPPLTTFQSPSSQPARMNQALKVSGHKQSLQNPIYSSPISATKEQPLPSILWRQQQRSNTCGERAKKPQVSITPTKHVSFQELPSQQRITSPVKQMELGDPWRREALENLEKKRQLRAVELLEQEVQQLRAKEKRTTEEDGRLRRLNLEWQFQKRLQEVQQRGEDEEEEEDLDMMVILQQKAENKRGSGGNDSWEQKDEKQAGNRVSNKEDEAKIEQRENLKHENMMPKGNQEEKTQRVSAPERLPFRERQRLFTLASSA